MESNYLELAKEMISLKIAEERYLTLKKYLRLYCKKYNLITSEEIEMIIKALEDEPLTEEKEK